MKWDLIVILFYADGGQINNREWEEGIARILMIVLWENEKNYISFQLRRDSLRLISHMWGGDVQPLWRTAHIFGLFHQYALGYTVSLKHLCQPLVPELYMPLYDLRLWHTLVLLPGMPFILVCLANSYPSFKMWLRDLFLCAAFLHSWPLQADLITDCFARPLTSNISLFESHLHIPRADLFHSSLFDHLTLWSMNY